MKKNNSLKNQKKPIYNLVITTGDQDGIGPEVSYKALAALGPQKNVCFFIYRSSNVKSSILSLLDKKFKRQHVSSMAEAFCGEQKNNTVFEIVSSAPPPLWVDEAAHAGTHRKISGIINAPLSKTLIHSSGLKDMGHTDILKRVSKSSKITMSFWGPAFSVALCSTHIPLSKAHLAWTPEIIENHLKNIIYSFPRFSQRPLRIGILGINPHAGENGLIGKDEFKVLKVLLAQFRKKFPQIHFSEPLVPDAAFMEKNQKKYDVYLCAYHDQGLIPFKMAHGPSRGCQISLGLPFVRTSVDHGTAKELFNKNRADAGSMMDALKMAVRLLFKTTYETLK